MTGPDSVTGGVSRGVGSPPPLPGSPGTTPVPQGAAQPLPPHSHQGPYSPPHPISQWWQGEGVGPIQPTRVVVTAKPLSLLHSTMDELRCRRSTWSWNEPRGWWCGCCRICGICCGICNHREDDLLPRFLQRKVRGCRRNSL